MAKRTVNRKRLLILAGAVAVGVGSAAGFVGYRRMMLSRQFTHLRSAGLAAAGRGDNVTAVQDLEPYLGRYPDDATALAAYAAARPRVPLPQHQELASTIRALRYLVRLEPSQVEYRRQLMDLYAQTGYLTESAEAAQEILQNNPDDQDALTHLVNARIRLHQFSDALLTSKHLCQLAPADLQAQLRQIYLLRETGTTGSALISAAEDAAKFQSDPVAVAVLRSSAMLLVGDFDDARQLLRTTAGKPLSSSITTDKLLMAQMDQAGLFSDSLAVLKQIVSRNSDPALAQTLVRRLWEGNRFADVVAVLNQRPELKTGAAAGDDVLALDAMSLYQLHRVGEAAPLLQALHQRSGSAANEAATARSGNGVGGDAAAAAWLIVLRQIAGDAPIDSQQLFQACQSALAAGTDDPFLRYFRGNAYVQLGENELAAADWRAVAQQETAWALPLVRLASLYSMTGQFDSAMQAAQEAVRRSPTDVGAVVTLAKVWEACAEQGRFDEPQPLLNLVEQVQRQIPNEEQTLCVRVTLLGRLQRTGEATRVLSDALSAKSPLSERSLIQLADISRRFKLGLTQQCYDRSERDHGISPMLAYAKAANLFADGHADQGLQSFDADHQRWIESKQVSSPNAAIAWELTRVRYLDITQNAAAHDALVKLADAHPDDARVQQLALTCQSARSDRDFLERVIGRMHRLTGEKGVAWRVAQARLDLDATGGAADDASVETGQLLNDLVLDAPDLVEPHYLLAHSLERSGKVSQAIEQLNVASQLDPRATSVSLYLAKLLQSQGDFEGARAQLERVASGQMSGADQRRQAAALLAVEGDTQQAIDLLEEAGREASQGKAQDLLLANLYRQRNELNQADEVARRLLQNQPDAADVQFAADLFATEGKSADASAALAQLDHLKLQPGLKQLVLADYAAHHLTVKDSLEHFRQATVEAPTNPITWRSLVAGYIADDQPDQALAAASEGLAHVPSDATLNAVRKSSDLLKNSLQDPELRPLVLAFVQEPISTSVAEETLQTVDGIRRSGQSTSALARQLAILADQHARFLPLQMYLATVYLKMNQLDQAANLASRAAEVAPSLSQPLQLLTRIYVAGGRWPEALDAATRWHDRSLDNPVAADLIIAQADLHVGQPEAAMKRLEPYLNLPSQPQVSAQARALYAQAGTAAGGTDAAVVMEPLLHQGPKGIATWLDYAVSSLPTEEAEAWFAKAAAALPAEDDKAQVMLAEAWVQLAQRSGKPAYLDRARSLLLSLLQRPNPSFEVYMAAAIRHENDGDLAGAESLYRQALQRQPKQPIALNNLAMVLVKRGQDLPEAEQLATQAIALWPRVAALQDTLASVQQAQGKFSDAGKSEATAVSLEPAKAEYRIRLIKALCSAGDISSASRALEELDAMNLNLSKIDDASRSQLESLRRELGKRADAASGDVH